MKPLRFAVIGSPVAHSKSPAMHEAAYRALGLPHTYEKLETTEAEVASRVDALRQGVFSGLNVTVPHKTRVLAFVDAKDASVLATGAANTLVREPDGSIRAHNTDAPALAAELERLGANVRGRSAVVLGTGGAARAAVWALGRLGANRVLVLGRSAADASVVSALRAILRGHDPAASLDVGALQPAASSGLSECAAVVQATSCGMAGGDPGELVADAIAWSMLPRDAVALDVVYSPHETPFLRAARSRSLVGDDGLGMLARQGALAFELWLGRNAPLSVMRDALGS